MLHIIATPILEHGFVGEDLQCLIENCGLGPALDLDAFYGDDPNGPDDPTRAAGLTGDFMDVGEKKTAKFNLQRVRDEGLGIAV